MKTVFKSILFIAVVLFVAVAADQLKTPERGSSMMTSDRGSQPMSEADFLSDVIAHHEGAIVMAYEALEKSSRPEIIEFANTVITMEKKNIDKTYVWRRDWYGDGSHIFVDQVDPKITMIEDLGPKDDQFDRRFLEAMIAHHEGAIKMLSEILGTTTRTEIKEMATPAIAGLSQDVIIMNQWLKEWYAQ